MARLRATELRNSSDAILNSHAYDYNVGHQRTNQAFASGSPWEYTYDNIGQLVFANSPTSSEDRGYFYDAAWNLNRQTNNAGVNVFSVNVKNELTNALGSSLDYDANGNLTTDLWLGGEFSYDDENQLIGPG